MLTQLTGIQMIEQDNRELWKRNHEEHRHRRHHCSTHIWGDESGACEGDAMAENDDDTTINNLGDVNINVTDPSQVTPQMIAAARGDKIPSTAPPTPRPYPPRPQHKTPWLADLGKMLVAGVIGAGLLFLSLKFLRDDRPDHVNQPRLRVTVPGEENTE